MTVGESVTLSLTFDGASPTGAPALPPMPNLRVSPNISQSQQISIANGQQRALFTYNYVLVATQPGDNTYLAAPEVDLLFGRKEHGGWIPRWTNRAWCAGH